MNQIGIISDTHGMLREETLALLEGCDAILHAGDCDRPEILDRLRAVAPLYAVRGNADKEWAKDLPLTQRIDLFGIRFFMIHNRKQIGEELGDRNVVIYGHSHRFSQTVEDGRLWLNPGSCGPKRFFNPVTMAILVCDGKGGFEVCRKELAVQGRRAADDGGIPRRTDGQQADAGGFGVQTDLGLPKAQADRRTLIEGIVRDINKGRSVDEIAARRGISRGLSEQICRLYLTHPGIDAEGIMNKMG